MATRRLMILIASFIVGILAICGSVLFAIAGAGMYGSPFAGDRYFNTTLLLVILCGPVAVLPCTLLDWQKPGYGGVILCGFALIDVFVILLNNIREWGFAVHAAGLASFCLAFPVFVIGTLQLFSAQPHVLGLKQAWWSLLLLALTVAGYFLWHVGADGVGALFELLRGGTI